MVRPPYVTMGQDPLEVNIPPFLIYHFKVLPVLLALLSKSLRSYV